ncbi:MAG: hypothetical protein ABS44_01745 [Chryseobacterium sp. SCN 40-13]|nr:MAG: hypothetical protein ABS44_01745 [Chryseobacterium sp. SCN 40-13]
MKYIYTFLLTFIGLISSAQSINTSSTAEECIAFISGLMSNSESLMPKYDKLVTSFDGINYKRRTDSKNPYSTSSSYILEYKDIDWTAFAEMKIHDYSDTSKIIHFHFSKSFRSESRYENQDKKTTMKSVKWLNLFYIILSSAQLSHIKELETAAYRLSEIAKAGVNPKLTIKADKNKVVPKIGNPTYEETVEYIENHFKDEFFIDGNFEAGYSPTEGLYMSRKITIKWVFIEGCKLHFGYKITSELMGANTSGREDTEFFTNEIDLSRVESISLIRTGDEHFVYGLAFNEKNNPNSKNPYLPFTRTLPSSDFQELEETQIYKAFNHLRKLCGAPEPLKF